MANGQISRWNAAIVLVPKKGQARPCLTFNYQFVYENNPGNHMELAQRVHDFLSNPSHGVHSHLDLKHGYWAIAVYPADRHLLAFSIPGLEQYQPTRMPQGARTSAFTMTELVGMALGAIPPPQPEPSLLHSKERTGLVFVAQRRDSMRHGSRASSIELEALSSLGGGIEKWSSLNEDAITLERDPHERCGRFLALLCSSLLHLLPLGRPLISL